MDKKITKNALETKGLGLSFAKELKKGDLLLFYGDLGAGKTTFIQGLSEGLGIDRRVTSPTFVIVREHFVGKNSVKNFYHVDLYRIEGQKEIDELGITDLMNDKESIVAIEWAEKIKTMPAKGYRVFLNYIDEEKREIKIEKNE